MSRKHQETPTVRAQKNAAAIRQVDKRVFTKLLQGLIQYSLEANVDREDMADVLHQAEFTLRTHWSET